ncbi:MAG: hypothetical protein AB7T06_43320 [Kofleriaceae bacterium]
MNRFARVTAFLLAGCQVKEAPPEPAPITEPSPPTITEPDEPREPATVKEHMKSHFAAVVAVERAIVRGRLADAREGARALLAHDEPAIEGGAPFVADMNDAAAALIAAPDLPTAGTFAAALGRTCSRCHEATRAVIAFAWEPQPDPAPSLRVQMQRHQWAAARLWEGLVGPSDEMWRQGTEALAATELDALAAGRGVARGDVDALAAQVRELARSAATAGDGDARAALYGRLLSTCAGCHQLVRPEPVDAP